MPDSFRETVVTRINDLQCEVDILEERLRSASEYQKSCYKAEIKSKKNVIKINERWLYRLDGGFLQ